MSFLTRIVDFVNGLGAANVSLDDIAPAAVDGVVRFEITGEDLGAFDRIKIDDFDKVGDAVDLRVDLSTFSSDFTIDLKDERDVDCLTLLGADEIVVNNNGSATVTFTDANGEARTVTIKATDAKVALGGDNGLEIGPGVGQDEITGGGGDDTISGGAGDDTIEGGEGADSIVAGVEEDALGGSGERAVDFPLIRLGNREDIDPDEWNGVSENAADLIGSYGDAANPLSGGIVFAYANDLNNDDRIDDNDGGRTAETYEINGEEVALDSVQAYFATVHFADGTSGEFTAVVIQMENGDVYLAPEPFQNADSALLESGEIQSIALNELWIDNSDLYGLRLDAAYQIGDDDYVDAGEGDDTVSGGAGDDEILGGAGGDSVLGGVGADALFGGSGDDVLDGGSGEDYLKVGSGADIAYGGAGGDTLQNASGDDQLFGGSGDDSLVANVGNDSLFGGDGRDTLTSGSGDDSLDGGSGADTLFGGLGEDKLTGGSGDDSVEGGAGGDFVYGGAGADTLSGGSGDDSLSYFISADGVNVNFADALAESGGDAQGDVLSGFELIEGSNVGGDTITADATDMRLFGHGGDDSLIGGSGANSLAGGSGADTISGGAGVDTLEGGSGDDVLSDGVGDDQIFGGRGADTLSGGLDEDRLFGGSGDDRLDGGSDDDTIEGGVGDDTLVAGFGSDRFDGGAGDDTYQIAGSAVENFSFDIDLVGGTDTYGNQYISIENIIGGLEDDTIVGSSADNRLEGDEGDDNVSGGLGEDSLYGGSGDDVLTGGAGDDALEGGSQRDTLDGGSGDDSLIAGTDNDLDVLRLSTGSDTIVGSTGGLGNLSNGDYLDAQNSTTDLTYTWTTGYGGAVQMGADTTTFSNITVVMNYDGIATNDLYDGADATAGVNILDGVGGDDTVIGSAFADYFELNSNFVSYGVADVSGGAGDDVIEAYLMDRVTLDGGAGADYIYTNTWGGTGGLLSGGSGDDTIIAFGADHAISGGLGNDSITAFDGADNVTGGAGADTIAGGAGADTLIGGSGDDLLTGGSGDDSIKVGTGGDTAFGGSGADTIQNASGDDSLVGGSGDDLIIATAGADTLEGGAGSDTLIGGSGDDSLVGGAGSDRLDGGSGDDRMFGGSGDDNFLFSDLFGNDTIEGGEGGSDTDTLDFSNLTGPVTVSYTGNEAGTVTDGTDTLTFSEIERIILTDSADLVNGGDDSVGMEIVGGGGIDSIYGGQGGDQLFAGSGDDDVFGAAGDDTIFGGDGNDGFSGGTGNDSLFGGAGVDGMDGASGDDTIFGGAGDDGFGGGIGNDALFGGSGDDGIGGNSGDDSIEGGAGNDGLGGDAGNDTILGGSGDDGIGGGDGADQLFGGDGADALGGGRGNDSLEGGAGTDTLGGGSGDDTVFGGAGGDQINEGAGADSIFGGSGEDTVFFADGFGNDTFVGGEGGTDADRVDFSGLTGPVTVSFSGDEIGTARDGTDTLAFSETEQFVLTDSSDLFFANLTGGAVNVDARAGDDTIEATSGDDTIDAGSGDDTIDGNSGADLIFAGAGRDTLDGDEENDTLFGGSGDDLFLSGTGADSAVGGAGSDTMSGDGGADSLFGGSGDDSLDGGAGDDSLAGGEGFDTFVLSSGDDTIADFGAATGAVLNDGDQTNNDFIDLAPYYDSIFELRADFADNGVLDQSNAADSKGGAVDYSDNTAMSGGTTFQGASRSSFTQDNTNVICFVEGVMILTSEGERPVETLRPGDRVATVGGASAELIWAGWTSVTSDDLRSRKSLRPVRIAAGALGNGSPSRDLLVSQQHRLLAAGPIVRRMFGVDEVLVPVKALIDLPGVEISRDRTPFRYHHICCRGHEVLIADGAAAESFFPAAQSLRTLSSPSRAALERAIGAEASLPWRPARPLATVRKGAALAARTAKHGKTLAPGPGQGPAPAKGFSPECAPDAPRRLSRPRRASVYAAARASTGPSHPAARP
ncbi:MAG: Hint domain-containing protein [Pseudomonadota bacterium]